MAKKLRFNDNGHISSNTNGKNSTSSTQRFPKLFWGPRAKTDNQQRYIEAIENNDIIFATGPSGSGKTHLAVGMAVLGIREEEFKKIIAIRPCVGVGRTQGYLPGGIEEKNAPFLRPILDELRKFYTMDEIERLKKNDILELGDLEHIRGRNFEDTLVILDEAQNCTEAELKVFLTRLCHGAKYIINGDISRDPETGLYTQCDLGLPPGIVCAFERQAIKQSNIDGIALVELTRLDIVRHPLVQKMIENGL